MSDSLVGGVALAADDADENIDGVHSGSVCPPMRLALDGLDDVSFELAGHGRRGERRRWWSRVIIGDWGVRDECPGTRDEGRKVGRDSGMEWGKLVGVHRVDGRGEVVVGDVGDGAIFTETGVGSAPVVLVGCILNGFVKFGGRDGSNRWGLGGVRGDGTGFCD